MASSASLDELQRKFEGNQRRYLAPLANEYRKTGDLDRAIELCRTHLPEYPEHLSGYVVFGQALYEAGLLDEASEAFTTALTLDPENLIALRHLGDIARDRGDRDGAREWYERVLDADPRNETIASAMQSLDRAPGSATPPSSPAASRPTPSAIEAPSLGYGMIGEGRQSVGTPSSVTPASVTPTSVTPASVTPASVTPASLTPQSVTPPSVSSQRETPAEVPMLDEPELYVRNAQERSASSAPEAADDAIDFDPGFFVDGDDATSTADGDVELASGAEQAASDASAGHEVDPSELALAAALDAPILDDPAPPAFDGDAAFDFQSTALDAELERSGDDALEPAASRRAPSGEYGDVTLDDAPEAGATADADDEEPAPFTPAYGGGFEAESFFASDDADTAPPAVTPPVDIGLESAEFVPPARAASETPAGAAPFVTETMAELYLQQGFRDEALDVYEQLVAASPDDEELRERLETVRRGQPSLELTDSFPAVGPVPAAPTAEPRAESPTASSPASRAQSAREFFAALARRGSFDDQPQASAGGSPEASYGAQSDADAGETMVAMADEPTDASAEAPGSLAELFGEPVANDDDERAASALASLVGDGAMHGTPLESRAVRGTPATTDAVPAPSAPFAENVTSAPSRPAARELSLDDVFGAPRPQARPTPNASFSFDQFFAEGQADAAPAPEPARGAAPADEGKDLEQFNAWLEGLKKR